MCPRDAGLANTAWFPDEPVCRLQDVPEWVKRQRRIAKKGANEKAGCFTLPMLQHHFVIKAGITGIDPDGSDAERKTAEKNWFNKHPAIKPITSEEREKLAARAHFARASLLRKSEGKTEPTSRLNGPPGLKA
jgi:hypothetical protein